MPAVRGALERSGVTRTMLDIQKLILPWTWPDKFLPRVFYNSWPVSGSTETMET
jgi:hypothetical protein